MTIRKIILLIIWVSFAAYTVWLAPLDRPDTWSLAQKLLTLRWGNLNPIILSIFWLMGVWPMIYACLMFADGRTQKIRAFPYFLGSNGTGVICLLPYLIWRQPNHEFYGEQDFWLSFLESRRTAFSLCAVTFGLLGYALLAGDWVDFVQQWHTRTFVHLITLDFCLMCLIFPLTSLFDDDMARRGITDSWIFWAVALVPLLGPLAYLCLRPPLLKFNLSTHVKAATSV